MFSSLLILLVVASMAAAAAAIGALWRRVDELTREVRELRRALETGPGVEAPTMEASRASAPIIIHADADDAIHAESEDVDTHVPTPLWTENASNDPFDDSWVIRRGDMSTPPAPRPPAPPPRLMPELNPPPLRAPSMRTVQSSTPDMIVLAAVSAALAAPAVLLPFHVSAFWIGAFAVLAVAGGFAVSLRPRQGAAAWIAAAAGALWSFWAALAAPSAFAACSLVALAACALLHAAQTKSPLPGGILPACAAAACFLTPDRGAAPMLAAMGAIIAASAILGAAMQRLEALHVGAWFAGCAALFFISGLGATPIWFPPAGAWAGALFLGVAAVRAPMLGRRGAVVSATGASAPILAAMSLHFVRGGLAAPWEAAAALMCVAALLTSVLAIAARRAGGLGELGIAMIPLGIGAPSAAALALLVAAPAPFAAAGLAALAAGLIAIDWRWPHMLWRVVAAAAMLAAVMSALGTYGLLASGVVGAPALLAIATGFAAPAGLSFAAARTAGVRAPLTATLFEAAAIGFCFVTLTALIRWAGGGGAPGSGPIGFAETGLYATAWGAFALLLTAQAHHGARSVRRNAGAALAGGALIILLVGPLTTLNPLWGVWRERADGYPLANMLALGFLAPAICAWGHWAFWRARANALAAGVALTCAGLFTALWTALETRRAFQGADLTMGPARAPELAAYIGVLAALIGAGIYFRFALGDQMIVSKSRMEGRSTRQAASFGPAARK